MKFIEKLKIMHRRLIEINPTSIRIIRKRRLEHDGGILEQEEDIGETIGRIYLKGETNIPQIVLGDAGEKQEEIKYGLAVEWDVDIKAETNERDYIQCELGDFEVLSVQELRYYGKCWGKIVELRRVS